MPIFHRFLLTQNLTTSLQFLHFTIFSCQLLKFEIASWRDHFVINSKNCLQKRSYTYSRSTFVKNSRQCAQNRTHLIFPTNFPLAISVRETLNLRHAWRREVCFLPKFWRGRGKVRAIHPATSKPLITFLLKIDWILYCFGPLRVVWNYFAKNLPIIDFGLNLYDGCQHRLA